MLAGGREHVQISKDLEICGTVVRTRTSHTPEEYAKAKRMNRTIKNGFKRRGLKLVHWQDSKGSAYTAFEMLATR